MNDIGINRSAWLKLLMGAAWLVLVLYFTVHHVVWRDEVRAFSFALQGDDIFAMLAGIHGEGHPAGWYVLLRLVHDVVGLPQVLQGVAFAVAAAAVALLLRYSPFGLPFLLAFMFSRFSLYEFSVMTRNYGISMLTLFLFAAYYRRYRHQGLLLGTLLFLLASCNVHSVVFVGALLLFWLLDGYYDESLDRRHFLRIFAANAALALLGILACVLVIYPPANDAAQISHPPVTLDLLKNIFLLPASAFMILAPRLPFIDFDNPDVVVLVKYLMTLVMFGSLLGLIRKPSALLAGLLSLWGLSVLFTLVYPGSYRHAALWLVFMTTLYWLVFSRDAGRQFAPAGNKWLKPLEMTGYALFVCLLLIQDIKIKSLFFQQPEGAASDVAGLVAATPALHDATIISDPDFMLESLPYYLHNRLYLLRENRFGNMAVFTANANLRLSLDDILATAETLRAQFQQPVVIIMQPRLDNYAEGPARVLKEGYNWELEVSPEQIARFRQNTRLLKRYEQVSINSTDEFYDVYVYAGAAAENSANTAAGH